MEYILLHSLPLLFIFCGQAFHMTEEALQCHQNKIRQLMMVELQEGLHYQFSPLLQDLEV